MSNSTAGLSWSQKLSLMISARSRRGTRFVLSQKNIYIFPSKAGFAFLGLLLLMLVTAINYQSSLIYMMTFLLGAVFFVSIWLCFLNLRGLQVDSVEAPGCFPGKGARFSIVMVHPNHHVNGLDVAANAKEQRSVSLSAGTVNRVEVPAGVSARGIYRLERLLVQTHYPFGLSRGWTWLKLDADCVVYPGPLEAPSPVSSAGEAIGEGQRIASTDKDLLRNFRRGDNMARVHWKKYASSDQLVVRDHSTATPQLEWLRWTDYPEASDEQRLSYLCYRIIESHENGNTYGLEVPRNIIEPGAGEKHRDACLHVLASYGFEQPSILPFAGSEH